MKRLCVSREMKSREREREGETGRRSRFVRISGIHTYHVNQVGRGEERQEVVLVFLHPDSSEWSSSSKGLSAANSSMR